ncbi:MAG: TMEM165/GDT1 family protein [Dehalococcoidia bacterium]|jgi:putative Ca2+/H+ antiporter (TMEM165/GDT1 family)|nr:TMEM165/GDT1 family protein [Dehalococcoidia bacterium]
MTALWSAFGLVFIAELGDKSMLMAMVLAPRYGASRVLLALALEAGLVMALAVLAGGAADLVLSEQQLALLSGVLFLAFGVWALRGGEDDDEVPSTERTGLLVLFALAAALFVSELGDKTQVAALSLSSVNPSARFEVWLGATVGMVAGDAIAVVAGRSLRWRLPQVWLARASGLLFIAFGAGAIVFAFW